MIGTKPSALCVEPYSTSRELGSRDQSWPASVLPGIQQTSLGDLMKRLTMILAGVPLTLSLTVLFSGADGQNDRNPPIREYYNEELAAKHLVPDSKGGVDPRFSDRLSHISMVRLLADPDRYHGKAIQVEGFLRVGFEDNAIYLSRDDASYLITKNGFWITIDHEEWKKRGADPEFFKNKHVLIEGFFDADVLGHVGLFSGGFEDVWRVQELRRW